MDRLSINRDRFEQPEQFEPSEQSGQQRLEQTFAQVKNFKGDFYTLNSKIKQLAENSEDWYTIGNLLQRISRERLFRNGGYRSFSEYCARGLGYSRQHIYKLIKVVKYIDKRWLQANSNAEREEIARLYALGFTKLYVLHTLPKDRLSWLMVQGLAELDQDGFHTTMEVATIEQLRQMIVGEPKEKVIETTGSARRPLLPTLLARSEELLQLIDQTLPQLGDQHTLKQDINVLRAQLLQLLHNARLG
jgi:hypothetical protein